MDSVFPSLSPEKHYICEVNDKPHINMEHNILIPLLLILPGQFQALGVQMAQPIADLLTLCCAVPLQLRELRRLREESPLPETP